jgi:hypothetical protein
MNDCKFKISVTYMARQCTPPPKKKNRKEWGGKRMLRERYAEWEGWL